MPKPWAAEKRENVAMTKYGTWVIYGGTARPALAVVLLAVAAALACAGFKLPLPAGPARPGQRAAVVMIAAWVVAMTAFLACVSVYVHQAKREHLVGTPADNILPVTLTAVGVTFVIIAVSGRAAGGTAVIGAVIGALAAPMVFELPFDLIVMARTYPPIPPHPALYRVLFFAPLFLIEITTLSLLTLSPMVRLSRATFYALALMLAVFAVWAVPGFGYPATPVTYTLNVISKLLAFVTILTLFLPRARARAEEPQAGQAQPQASG
jgi:hypothetical protein